MKKILAVTLIAALLLAGCAASGGAAKLGLGIKTTIGHSTDLTKADDGTESGKAEAYTVVSAVMVDGSGKVVDIKFDVAQTAINFDAAGKITSDLAAEYPTKRDKGDAYGMKKASGIGKEWWEQADAIENWMTGKTADQISGMKVVAAEGGGNVTDEADLKTGATIGIDDYIATAVEAIGNAK